MTRHIDVKHHYNTSGIGGRKDNRGCGRRQSRYACGWHDGGTIGAKAHDDLEAFLGSGAKWRLVCLYYCQ
jgi:hypothetical protein